MNWLRIFSHKPFWTICGKAMGSFKTIIKVFGIYMMQRLKSNTNFLSISVCANFICKLGYRCRRVCLSCHLTQGLDLVVGGKYTNPNPHTKRFWEGIWVLYIKTHLFLQRVGFTYLVHCRGLQWPEHGVPAERGACGHVGEPGAAVHLTVWEATRHMLALRNKKDRIVVSFQHLVRCE